MRLLGRNRFDFPPVVVAGAIAGGVAGAVEVELMEAGNCLGVLSTLPTTAASPLSNPSELFSPSMETLRLKVV